MSSFVASIMKIIAQKNYRRRTEDTNLFKAIVILIAYWNANDIKGKTDALLQFLHPVFAESTLVAGTEPTLINRVDVGRIYSGS